LVYDVTDRKSFVSISGWLKSVRQVLLFCTLFPSKITIFISTQISKESKVLLLGNKCDLRSSSSLNHSIVSTEEGKRFADENDLLFAEISVVNLEDSVIQSFDSLLEAIVRTAEEEKEKENEKEIEVYSIRPEVANKGIAPSSTPRQKKKSSFDFFRVIFKGMARSVSVSS
jgi:GTPase SAR1 family protein